MLNAKQVLAQGALAAALLTSVFETGALAQPTKAPIMVLEVATEDVDDAAKALTQALRDEIRSSPDLTLVDADNSLQVMMLALKCSGDVPDTNCQAKIGDKLKADRYVWGTARKGREGEVSADLHLWQRAAKERRYQLSFDARLAAATRGKLASMARDAVNQLVRGAMFGTVRILGKTDLRGEIFVDGVSSGTIENGQAEIRVAPGSHLIEVRNAGAVLASERTNVEPGASVVLSVTVASTPPSAKAPPSATPVADSTSQPPQAARWQRPAGWAGVGVGAALIVGGFVSMAQVASVNNDSGFDAYRRGIPTGMDVCDAAKAGRDSTVRGAASASQVSSDCDRAGTFEVMQWVFFGLGAASAGVGGYLLWNSSRTQSNTALIVSPGSQRSTVGVAVSF